MEANPFTLQLSYFDRLLAIKERGVAVTATQADLLDEIDAQIQRAADTSDDAAEAAYLAARKYVKALIGE